MREQDWRANYYEAIRERNAAEATVERVRRFVDGFAERGGHAFEAVGMAFVDLQFPERQPCTVIVAPL